MVTLCSTRFTINKVYLLNTECIYVFYMDLRTKSDYLLIVQH